MDWFAKSVNLAYFPTKDKPLKDRWTRLREVAEMVKLSPKGREKLDWIIFYYTYGKRNAKITSQYFGTSRKTFHKWLKRFDEKKLLMLEEKSRSPNQKRCWEVTEKEEERILDLRKKHIKYGKKKIKVLYRTIYKESISTWKIERVVRKWKLYPDQEKQVRRLKNKAKRKEKTSIHLLKKKDQFGFLWHIDAITIWWYGQRRTIFTAMEDMTKIAFARVYKTNSSGFAQDFLERLMYLTKGKVEIMHSDNGSEFAGDFEKACKSLLIQQVYSRPHTPKDNPALERFNWTIQDEWLSLSEVGLDDLKEANKDLTLWLVEYNNFRPHETLDYLTPLEYAQGHYFKVLPMWSARTQT